jgi:hypothetical protein
VSFTSQSEEIIENIQQFFGRAFTTDETFSLGPANLPLCRTLVEIAEDLIDAWSKI